MSDFGVQGTGQDQVSRFLAELPGSIRARLRVETERLTMEMRQAVKAKLSGPVLNIRTAHLIDSIGSEVVEGEESVTGIVASNDGQGVIDPKTGFNYAKFWEFDGGSLSVKAHLKTVARGNRMFQRQVRPGTRNAGRRPYMVPTLDEFRARIVADLSAAADPVLAR